MADPNEPLLRGDRIQYDRLKRDIRTTRHGLDKINRAIDTLSKNYEQISGDSEHELCLQSIEVLQKANDTDIKGAIEETLPESDITRSIREGRIEKIDVQRDEIYSSHGDYILTFEVQVYVGP